MKKIRLTVLVLVILAVVYLVATPYITVYQIRAAAKQHDASALSAHINFPAVRNSLKSQAETIVASGLLVQGEPQDNPLAALGVSFAGLMVNSLIDALVTPAGVADLLAGEGVGFGELIPGGEATGKKGKHASTDDGRTTFAQAFDDITLGYQSFDRFVVKPKDTRPAFQPEFVLTRQGLGWRLSEIVLPPMK